MLSNQRWLYMLILLLSSAIVMTAVGGGFFNQSAPWYLQWQHQAFLQLCHQIPERSFWFGGQPMAVCSRCLGIYGGFLLGWIFLPVVSKWDVATNISLRKVALIALLLNLIDVGGSVLGFLENTSVSRLLLGSLMGGTAAFLFIGSFSTKQLKQQNIIMEDYQQQTYNSEPSYWNSVAIAGILFGVIVFALSLLTGYATINSEPTGSLFSPTQLIGTLGCLVGAFGGMLAIWHYTGTFNLSVTLGRGALIGFLTGVAISVVNVLLSEGWTFIDPDMTQQMVESTIANIEASDLPEQQKQQMIDLTAGSREGDGIGSQLLSGIPLYGILNLITGMIGAKIFGSNPQYKNSSY